MERETEQPAGLISVLLDTSAPLGDRHDAAMDLAAFDGRAVQAALMEILLTLDAEDLLVEAAAESFGEQWTRSGKKNFDAPLDEMHPAAKTYFGAFFS